MEGPAKGKFKMKGHTLPGINQRSEGNTDLPDGRSGSSPFQDKSPAKDTQTKIVNDPNTGTTRETLIKHTHDEESPAKQSIKGHRGQYQRFKAPQYDFTGISKSPKPTSTGMPKSFNMTGSSASDTPGYKDTKMAKTARAGKKVGKKVAKKVAKAVGGRALGVAGMMMAKTASADQPGTGAHGGKKQTKYNPKSGKYE